MVRSHYNQRARLKHFSRHEGNHDKLTMVDLKNRRVGSRNIETAFYEEGLYSDELERELNTKIEAPGMRIFAKVYESDRFVTLSRYELEILKKYLLIQQYRNPTNISHYDPEWEGDILHINQRYNEKGSNFKEHVYTMMHEVLDHSWKDLIESDITEIRDNAQNINGNMTLFVKSDHEFVINDLGLVTERQPWSRFSKDPSFNEMIKSEFRKEGITASDEEFRIYFERHQYHDNFTFYPISSNFGIVTIDTLWTNLIKAKNAYRLTFDNQGELYTVADPDFFRWMRDECELKSEFIQENFVPCIPYYRSEDIRKASTKEEMAELLRNNKSPQDLFVYPVIDLSLPWALYLNRLTINEAVYYFAFGSNQDGKITVDNYEMERLIYTKPGDAKNNLSWLQNISDWTQPLI